MGKIMKIETNNYKQNFRGIIGQIDSTIPSAVAHGAPLNSENQIQNAVDKGIQQFKTKLVKNIGNDEFKFSISKSEMDGMRIVCENANAKNKAEACSYVPKKIILTDWLNASKNASNLYDRINLLTTKIEVRKLNKLPTDLLEKQLNELTDASIKFSSPKEYLKFYFMQSVTKRIEEAAREAYQKRLRFNSFIEHRLF